MKKLAPLVFLVDVDDKLRILTAVKEAWGERVTTVFSRQGDYALDPVTLASYAPADVTVERISDLLLYDLSALLPGHKAAAKAAQLLTTQPTLN